TTRGNNSSMFAFIKRRRFSFALLVCFVLVFLGSYFSLARNQRSERQTTGPAPALNNHATNNVLPHSLSLDSDNDGIPDTAELPSYMDRENFRRWFTLIAEGQFYHLSEQWNAEPRDCAGLVRFAWRESLRHHDRAWLQ